MLGLPCLSKTTRGEAIVMDIDRRGLLKVAGLPALGLLIKPGWQVFSRDEPSDPSPETETLARKRWGMGISLRKCWKAEGCRDCIDACHRIHNVPDMGTLKEEIKWIWQAPYEKVFTEHEFEVTEEDYQQ